MCIHFCVCIYMCVYICVCACMHTCMHMYLYMCVTSPELCVFDLELRHVSSAPLIVQPVLSWRAQIENFLSLLICADLHGMVIGIGMSEIKKNEWGNEWEEEKNRRGNIREKKKQGGGGQVARDKEGHWTVAWRREIRRVRESERKRGREEEKEKQVLIGLLTHFFECVLIFWKSVFNFVDVSL